MRRFYSSTLAGTILLLAGTSAKADYDYYAIKNNPHGNFDAGGRVGLFIYKVNFILL